MTIRAATFAEDLMTFDELDNTLPNGFHDAYLHRIEMDYITRTLQLVVVVWIGDMDDPPRKEAYRQALVTVKDVAYLVIEPPDFESPQNGGYPWEEPGEIRFDTGEGPVSQSNTILPPAPVGTTANWMYLSDFNRCLFFAAGDATLEWTGPEEDRN